MSGILFKSKRVIGWITHTRPKSFQPRNPRDPHFDRKRMLEVCKPIYLPDFQAEWETCSKNALMPEIQAHPYEKLLCMQLKKKWEASRMICFYHMNPMTTKEKRAVHHMFFKKDLFLHVYSSEVVKLAVKQTPFQCVMDLFESSTVLVLSPNTSIKDVLQLSKKTNFVILLAAIVDNVFYSKSQLESIAKLPKKEVLYQQLCHSLQNASLSLSQTVTQNTQLLSSYLTQLSKQS